MEEGSPHLDIFVISGPSVPYVYMPFISLTLDRMAGRVPILGMLMAGWTPQRSR